MNTSELSFYDNVNSPESVSKSCIYSTINDVLNINTDYEVRIFCPLCVSCFGFKFSLFEHLKTFHNSFLIQARNKPLKFKECPFCYAKFYGEHLRIKHVLQYHPKVVRGLFINKDKTKCFFCNENLDKENCDTVKHIEELHILDFEEEFSKRFLNDTIPEMTMSEFVNSTIEDDSTQLTHWKDICMSVGKNAEDIKNFDEASMINCYDFTDLKQQLENIQGVESKQKPHSTNKSILKNITNSNKPLKTARRVLRFDLTVDNEDKENSCLTKNLNAFKQISIDEHKLLYDDKLNDTICEEPQHSSTPKNLKLFNNKMEAKCCKSVFKSKVFKNVNCKSNEKLTEFDYQCGKCRLLFKENLELVCHVKNNHKKFSFNVFQPCYHCAICNARFYRNRYLRKHHDLHKPY